MLRTIRLDLSTRNLVLIGEDSTVSEVGDSKVNRAKVGATITKSKSKNLVKSILSKSQSSIQSFRSGFHILKARQAFIKISIFDDFHPKCHICIKTHISDYAIGRVLNQLILND